VVHYMYRSLILAVAFALTTAVFAQEPAEQGRILFEQLCTSCHTIGGGDRIGPDLAGMTERRDPDWLLRMISEPDKLIAEGDPVVTALIERYNNIVMPNLGLDRNQASAIVAYLQAQVNSAVGQARPSIVYERPEMMQPQARIWQVFLLISAVIVFVFSVVAFSTKQPREVSVARAYRLRRMLFLAALIAVIGILATTLPKAPYVARAGTDVTGVDRIIYVAARQFDFIWSDEPIVSTEDIGRVPRVRDVVIEPGSTVEFRVTSLDVNHGFGLYGPRRQIVAQTQAMPGYVNRLRVRLDEPGVYPVLCLEYCAAGHHLMRSQLTVRRKP